MKTTADIMVKAAGLKWKQIEAHVNRTQPYYSNQNVDVHRIGHNVDGQLENYSHLNKKRFMPYIRAYNLKAHKQGNNSRMYGKMLKHKYGYLVSPVRDFLNRSKRRNERMVVFYLGNKNVRKSYYRILKQRFHQNTAQIRDMENRALVHTAEVWNQHNPYLKITDFATNTDETTAHIHTRMLAIPPLSLSKPRDMATAREKRHGKHRYVRKPSMSFNKAMQATYPTAINNHGRVDNRIAMKQMRSRYDPVIIRSFNRELCRNGIKYHLTLERTGKVNHFNLQEYQAHKDMARTQSKQANAESEVAGYTRKVSSVSLAASKQASIVSSYKSTESSISSASSAVARMQQSAYTSKGKEIKKYFPLENTNMSEYRSIAKHGTTIEHAGYMTGDQMISSGIQESAEGTAYSVTNDAMNSVHVASSSISMASSSIATLHSNIRGPIDRFACSFQNGGHQIQHWHDMNDHEAISNVSHITDHVSSIHDNTRGVMINYLTKYDVKSTSFINRNRSQRKNYYRRWADNDLFELFRISVNHISKWTDLIRMKLHRYHLHLKHLFKRFFPWESDQNLDRFAKGTRYFVKHPQERQESILFRLEDNHARNLTREAQRTNENIYSDNQNYQAYPDYPEPGHDNQSPHSNGPEPSDSDEFTP